MNIELALGQSSFRLFLLAHTKNILIIFRATATLFFYDFFKARRKHSIGHVVSSAQQL